MPIEIDKLELDRIGNENQWSLDVSKINWAPETGSFTKQWSIRDIFNPEQNYTNESISDAIWFAWWIGWYWFHEDSEKHIHLSQLIRELPKTKFTTRQKDILISQIIDNIELFGEPKTIASNLSYLIQAVPNYVSWKNYNQLVLWFQRLVLGKRIILNQEKLLGLDSKRAVTPKEKQASVSTASLPNFSNLTVKIKVDADARDNPFSIKQPGHDFNTVSMSKTENIDFVSAKVQKAETVIQRRKNVHLLHKDSLKSYNKEEMTKESMFKHDLNKIDNKLEDPLDKDKRVYKKIMSSQAVNEEIDEKEVVRIYKRTMKDDLSESNYEYKINPSVYCYIWKNHLNENHLEKAMPKHGDKAKISDIIEKEKQALSECTKCNSWRVKATIIIYRCLPTKNKVKTKYEKYAEYQYIGPFELFDRLKFQHKSESGLSTPKLKKKSTSESERISGLLNEISPPWNSYKILQIDVRKLFTDQKEVFWNLIYRFVLEKRDYYFMLPYEADFEDLSSVDSSSDSSYDINDPSIRTPRVCLQNISSFGKVQSTPSHLTSKIKSTKTIQNIDFGIMSRRGSAMPEETLALNNPDTKPKFNSRHHRSRKQRKSF